MSPDDFPTYQVYIVESGSGDEYPVSDPVTTLDEATQVVFDLDREYINWEADGFPALQASDILNHYEGCDLYCRRGNSEWMYNSDEEWEEVL